MASLPILHGPEAFCLRLSHWALCIPWPAASVLRLQPDDWEHNSNPLLLAGGEGNDQFGTDIKKSSSIAKKHGYCVEILLAEAASWWGRFNQSFGHGDGGGGLPQILPENGSLNPACPLESPGECLKFWHLCPTPEILIELLGRREPESRSFQVPQVRRRTARLEVGANQSHQEKVSFPFRGEQISTSSPKDQQQDSHPRWKAKSSKWGRNGAQCKESQPDKSHKAPEWPLQGPWLVGL